MTGWFLGFFCLTLLHVAACADCLQFGSPAHLAEREASCVWSLKEAFAAYLIMEPLRSDGAFAQEPNPLWINKPFLHKQPARPALIIIQSQRIPSPMDFMVSRLVWASLRDGFGRLVTLAWLVPPQSWVAHCKFLVEMRTRFHLELQSISRIRKGWSDSKELPFSRVYTVYVLLRGTTCKGTGRTVELT